jgi:NTE family protein
MNSVGIQPADFVIEPNVAGVDLSDFARTRDLADVGERAAVESMSDLKTLLSKLDDKLFKTG